MTALEAVKKAQSDNLGPVVTAVLDATRGDEQAYLRLMREAADAGHPVAPVWSASQTLRQLYAGRADLVNAPAAKNVRAAIEQAAGTGYVPAVVEIHVVFYYSVSSDDNPFHRAGNPKSTKMLTWLEKIDKSETFLANF